MSTLFDHPREDTLEALRHERARQDDQLQRAWVVLQARGRAPVMVPCDALESIDAACLVSASTLRPSALRG